MPRIRKIATIVFRWTVRILAVVGLCFSVYHAGFELTVVCSPSMAPALQGTNEENGDWVLTERVSRWFAGPRRYDVVAFHDGEGVSVMKRVVGLPGEKISLRDHWACANGIPLERPAQLAYLVYYAYGSLYQGKEAECADGYFVLGDFSRDSQDSRFEGPVRPEKIRGRAWLRIWPWNRIGWVR